MQRRAFLTSGSMAAMAVGTGLTGDVQAGFNYTAPMTSKRILTPPRDGKLRVAFAILDGVQVIDLAGPWEVFQDVHLVGSEYDNMADRMPFELYTVAEAMDTITATGGMQLVPNYSVDDAPQPHLVVIPHFGARNFRPIHDWIRSVAAKADLTMSICTGAFQLAQTGLLDGQHATTFHMAWDRFANAYPKVILHRGPRFVENDRTATAGGLTSGMDLALRTVDRYYDRQVAQHTADMLEYTSEGWKA